MHLLPDTWKYRKNEEFEVVLNPECKNHQLNQTAQLNSKVLLMMKQKDNEKKYHFLDGHSVFFVYDENTAVDSLFT